MKAPSSREIIIHMSWMLAIVSILAIIFFAKDFSSITDLDKILSFALSFASLILALIAITQTLLSNSSATELFSAVYSAAETIRKSSESLDGAATGLKGNIEALNRKIEEPSARLSEALTVLDQKYTDLSGQAAEIARHSSELKAITVAHDQSPSLFDENNKSLDTNNDEPPYEDYALSKGQILSLYMCIMSYEYQLDFNPAEILKPDNISPYYPTTVSALKTFRLIEMQEAGPIFRVTDLKNFAKVRDDIVGFVRDEKDSYYPAHRKRIDLYFESRKPKSEKPDQA